MFHDIVYYTTLILSITLGSYYKRIENLQMKRNYGTGLGIIIICLICGYHLYHTIVMVCTNIIILKFSDRQYVHMISLVYTWLHLLYLHIGIQNSCYILWLHQNIALRLVGLAFEIHTASVRTRPSSVRLNIGDTENEVIEPSSADIISYAIFFLGLHKGPYYKYKVFNDHLKGSFGNLGDCRKVTEKKLKKVFIYLIGYLLLRTKYSSQIFFEEEFYDYDMDTRYLYNIPLLVMFFLQSQIVMLLCTSVCTEAGFGVYPTKTQPLPGHGPSIKLSLLKLAATPNLASEQTYNFSMLKCFENEKLLIGPRMKDTLKCWDMTIRYWFWANIYKSMFKASKEMRRACSFLAFTLWSGPSLHQIIISSTLWVHIHLEEEYKDIYDTRGTMKLPWDIGLSIMRLFCLIYLTPCFIIDDAATVLRYYYSIFWVFHIILLVLIVGAIVANKSREMNCYCCVV